MKEENREKLKKEAAKLDSISNIMRNMDSLIKVLRIIKTVDDTRIAGAMADMVADRLESMDRYSSIWCTAFEISNIVADELDDSEEPTIDDIPTT